MHVLYVAAALLCLFTSYAGKHISERARKAGLICAAVFLATAVVSLTGASDTAVTLCLWSVVFPASVWSLSGSYKDDRRAGQED